MHNPVYAVTHFLTLVASFTDYIKATRVRHERGLWKLKVLHNKHTELGKRILIHYIYSPMSGQRVNI